MKKVINNKKSSKNIFFLLIMFFLLTSFYFSPILAEESAQEIQEKINQQDNEIKKLEKAIAESEKKVKEFAGQSASLKKEIANLDYLNSKLKKIIYQKEKEIKKLKEKISELSGNISNNQQELNNLQKYLKKNLFLMNQIYNNSRFENLLSGQNISEISQSLAEFEKMQDNFKKSILKYKKLIADLDVEKKEKEEENQKLDQEKDELSDKKALLDKNKQDKAYLLKITKNKEANFKKILSEQKKAKAQFEEQLFKLESKLNFILDKSTIPPEKVGLFSWPTPKWPSNYHWITQFFGLTTFREIYYNGKGHNGIDIGVPVGTPVYSVMDGVVLDTGDTTKVCRGVQYGRWVTVDHGNGLTSMYAHLSVIKVKKGDKVKRGQKVALSGNTGYSTGPHLHFTIYYTKGLKIKTIPHPYPGRCYKKPMKIPIASHKAYTDPFKYLPKPEFVKLKAVKHGQSGKSVKELQNMLKYEKVFPRNVSANGYYGNITAASVKRWKEKYKISGDGKEFTSTDLKKFKEIY